MESENHWLSRLVALLGNHLGFEGVVDGVGFVTSLVYCIRWISFILTLENEDCFGDPRCALTLAFGPFESK